MKRNIKVLLAFLALFIKLSYAQYHTGQVNSYPRFFSTVGGDNDIVAIDADFDSDTLFFIGHTTDGLLIVPPITSSTIFRTVVSAMSINQPIYKWA